MSFPPELSIFYCEEALHLLSDCGIGDQSYFAALVRMFERALTTVMTLPPTAQADLVDRLDRVSSSLSGIGWGVKDAVDDVWFDLDPRQGDRAPT